MSLKSKYNKIDQGKLPKSITNVLAGIKRKTKNFTDEAEMERQEAKLDVIIKGLKKKYPQALDKSKKPDEAKKKEATKTVLKMVAGHDRQRDARRTALPAGKRISDAGNVYYEYRVNRADKYAPNYPKNKPFLEKGGDLKEISEAIFLSNAKKGRIETTFGSKTLAGLMAMIENIAYSPLEITNALFGDSTKRLATTWGEKSKVGIEEMITKARNFDDGGEVYVDFLDSTNNFEPTRRYFNNSDQAVKWGSDNIEDFNPNMVFYAGNILEVQSRPVYTDFEIDLNDISNETVDKLDTFLNTIGIPKVSNEDTGSINITVRHPNNDNSLITKIRNFFSENFVKYDVPLPFKNGGQIRSFEDLSRSDKDALLEELKKSPFYWYGKYELTNTDYDERFNEAKNRMAITGDWKKPQYRAFVVKKYWIGHGSQVKYPDSDRVGTVINIEPTETPNDYKATFLYDNGKKVVENISNLEIVGSSGFEQGGVLTYDQLSIEQQTEIDDLLADDMARWFDEVGVDMPEELEGDDYEIAMDKARDEMARQGIYKQGGDLQNLDISNSDLFEDGGNLKDAENYLMEIASQQDRYKVINDGGDITIIDNQTGGAILDNDDIQDEDLRIALDNYDQENWYKKGGQLPSIKNSTHKTV